MRAKNWHRVALEAIKNQKQVALTKNKSISEKVDNLIERAFEQATGVGTSAQANFLWKNLMQAYKPELFKTDANVSLEVGNDLHVKLCNLVQSVDTKNSLEKKV